MAFAGGWIDQPFVSRLDPAPPGSMVVVGLEPDFRFMDRAGMATSTRSVALRLWGGRLPERDPAELVRELYAEENRGRSEPSGSQDMIGLVYPGDLPPGLRLAARGRDLSRAHRDSTDPAVAPWLEQVVHLLPVAQRPDGYNPLEIKNLDPAWIRRLGPAAGTASRRSWRRDLEGFGASLNECMACWEAILPRTVRHPALTVDLRGHPALLSEPLSPAPCIPAAAAGYLYRGLQRAGAGQHPGEGAAAVSKMRSWSAGAFDDLRSAHVRLLQEAARLGPVHVLLWSDEQVAGADRPAAEVPAGGAPLPAGGPALRAAGDGSGGRLRPGHPAGRRTSRRRASAAGGPVGGRRGRGLPRPQDVRRGPRPGVPRDPGRPVGRLSRRLRAEPPERGCAPQPADAPGRRSS